MPMKLPDGAAAVVMYALALDAIAIGIDAWTSPMHKPKPPVVPIAIIVLGVLGVIAITYWLLTKSPGPA